MRHPASPTLLAAVVLLGSVACTRAQTPAQHFASDQDLELMLRYLVEDVEAEGIVLGVIERDGVTRTVSYGNSDPSGAPIGPGSVFEIASITKTFTATLLADMVARGEVDLDDPVSRHLPGGVTVPALGGDEITLLDLATHTSGLSDPVLVEALTARGISNYLTVPVNDLYAVVADYDLPREPGSAFEYSNVGFALLGLALAEAGGAPLRGLVAERILEPAGMVRTGYDVEQVSGHYGGEAVPPTASSVALDGAGGLRSNMEDMLRYLAANLGQPETDLERAMRTAHEALRPASEGGSEVGLAWHTFTLNGRRLIEHGGDVGGFTARIAFDPERQVGAVILTNSREFNKNMLTDLVVHDPILASESVAPERDVLGGRTGTYVVEGLPYFVRLEDEGYLTLQPSHDARMRLYARSDTLFFTKREEWSFAFPTIVDDASPDLLMYVNGRTREGTRIDVRPPPPAAVAGNVGLPVDPEAVAPYLGVYDVPVGQDTLTLSVFFNEASGRLMSTFAGTPSRLVPSDEHRFTPWLVPSGEHRFRVVINPSIQVAFDLVDGIAERATLSQGNRSDTGVRRR